MDRLHKHMAKYDRTMDKIYLSVKRSPEHKKLLKEIKALNIKGKDLRTELHMLAKDPCGNKPCHKRCGNTKDAGLCRF